MEAVWNKAKSAVKEQIAGHSYRMWIEPLELIRADGEAFTLACPNSFSRKRVLEHYARMIEYEMERASGQPFRLSIEVCRPHGPEPDPPGVRVDAAGRDGCRQLHLPNMNIHPSGGRFLRKEFTFDQFVVGGNNDFAYSAALSLASGKHRGQNSLFLLSKTGMGKSHLSQAVGNHILTHEPAERVYYVTAEDFANEMVHSFRNDTIDKFKEKYRNQCDVLLLEDIQFLTGKERTQIELAFTLDTLCQANKKLIFTSCYLPGEIPKLHESLRSRLSCSIISGIDAPNFKTRVKILKAKARAQGVPIPEDIIHYLAGELTDNVRQLESGLIGVAAKSSLLARPIDLGLAESVVKNIAQSRKEITIESIKKMVSKYFKVSVEDLVSRSRKQNLVRPRQIAIYLARKYTDQPLQSIGKSFNRYHATALHAIGIVERGLKEKGIIQKQVEYLCQKLESERQ